MVEVNDMKQPINVDAGKLRSLYINVRAHWRPDIQREPCKARHLTKKLYRTKNAFDVGKEKHPL